MKRKAQVITDKLRDDDDAASIENDWKFAAMVRYAHDLARGSHRKDQDYLNYVVDPQMVW